MTEKNRSWWGDYRVPLGSTASWQIGPMTLWIQRLQGELRIAHETVEEEEYGATEVIIPAPHLDLLAIETVTRFAMSSMEENVRVLPALADRPVISRPEKPLEIPAGERTTIFVASPLWLRFRMGGESGWETEVALVRPSDTWFGPSTIEGELCYASRSFGRLDEDNLTHRPHRAASRVSILNDADTALRIERIKLPVNHLALYQSSDGDLWTDELHLRRSDSQTDGELQLQRRDWKTPRPGATLVSEPRETDVTHTAVKFLGSLFL